MKKRLGVSDLEAMTTHEVADLLATLAQLLQRLPDVPMQTLQPVERPINAAGIAAGVRHEPKTKANTGNLPAWVAPEE